MQVPTATAIRMVWMAVLWELTPQTVTKWQLLSPDFHSLPTTPKLVACCQISLESGKKTFLKNTKRELLT